CERRGGDMSGRTSIHHGRLPCALGYTQRCPGVSTTITGDLSVRRSHLCKLCTNTTRWSTGTCSPRIPPQPSPCCALSSPKTPAAPCERTTPSSVRSPRTLPPGTFPPEKTPPRRMALRPRGPSVRQPLRPTMWLPTILERCAVLPCSVLPRNK